MGCCTEENCEDDMTKYLNGIPVNSVHGQLGTAIFRYRVDFLFFLLCTELTTKYHGQLGTANFMYRVDFRVFSSLYRVDSKLLDRWIKDYYYKCTFSNNTLNTRIKDV